MLYLFRTCRCRVSKRPKGLLLHLSTASTLPRDRWLQRRSNYTSSGLSPRPLTHTLSLCPPGEETLSRFRVMIVLQQFVKRCGHQHLARKDEIPGADTKKEGSRLASDNERCDFWWWVLKGTHGSAGSESVLVRAGLHKNIEASLQPAPSRPVAALPCSYFTGITENSIRLAHSVSASSRAASASFHAYACCGRREGAGSRELRVTGSVPRPYSTGTLPLDFGGRRSGLRQCIIPTSHIRGERAGRPLLTSYM